MFLDKFKQYLHGYPTIKVIDPPISTTVNYNLPTFTMSALDIYESFRSNDLSIYFIPSLDLNSEVCINVNTNKTYVKYFDPKGTLFIGCY